MSEEDTPRNPWRTVQEFVTTTGGVIAIIGSIAAGLAWTIGVLPFVRTDVYNREMNSVVAKISGLEDTVKATAADLTGIKRNGLLNLQIALQSRVEILQGAMDNVQRGSSTYLGLLKERDTTQQQLDEVKRELNR